MSGKKTFEEQYDIIVKEIDKRQYKWTLKAVSWLDFSDVRQMILIHIFKKWDLWDQEKEFLPWINSVISNQIINLLRNLYMNVARPCVSCAANEGDDRCRIYSKQCADCPLFSRWEKTKKRAHDVKLPVSMENHLEKICTMPSFDEDIERKANTLHEKMKEVLTPIQYKIYSLLYVDGKGETEVAELMGYKSSEKHRAAGYRQVHNVKKLIVQKAKKIINTEFY